MTCPPWIHISVYVIMRVRKDVSMRESTDQAVKNTLERLSKDCECTSDKPSVKRDQGFMVLWIIFTSIKMRLHALHEK